MAEVVGTISFASQTTQGLIWFYRSVRDGGKEIKHLLVWLERLCVTLATLQGFLSNTTLFANLPSVQQLEKTIKDSQNGIDELGTILKKCTDTPPLSQKGLLARTRRGTKSLAYPFKKGTIQGKGLLRL